MSYCCVRCWEESNPPPFSRRMIVCPECGNKRCPKATDHRNDCSGSNEPGQVGSVYGEKHD